eukprot:TRINITY_DN6339_c0_g1_i2.p1 TRINITY_DN6339_c0_g1~~TRINITY_DN6339_c0_g1_i2.p1  ORF type:complete len:190 (+),score=41.55 TRINITY_DN6339_c0_g1_i2:95-664(+)
MCIRDSATLYHPDVLDQLHKNPTFAKVLDFVKDLHKLTTYSDFEERHLTHLLLTVDYCATDDQIFNLHTRIQHSCNPNVLYRITDEGIFHFACRQIKRGEELTVHYAQPVMFDFSFSMGPTVMRRARLTQTRQFMCKCEKCSQTIDLTRPLPCPDCGNKMQCELVTRKTEDGTEAVSYTHLTLPTKRIV